MTRSENRMIQAAWHGIAYAVLGSDASQARRKAFITQAKGRGRTRKVTEARVIFTALMRSQGFTLGQIGAWIGRSRQAAAHCEHVRAGWIASDPDFRRTDLAAAREFDNLLAL